MGKMRNDIGRENLRD